MNGRLCCGTCGAGLVPAWTGLKCPRASACGKGGLLETASSVRPLGLRHLHGRGDALA